MENEFLQKATSEKERIKELAEKLNIPLIIEENGTYQELQKILPDGSLIYYTTFNVDAARSTRTNHLNVGGSLGLNLMGQNMTAHIWDGGLARTTHQEYDGAGGPNRFSIGDGTTALHYHSAHVTGTIIASGVSANAKGMAPHARAIGYEWNNDLSEATSAASNGMLISNHSYGYRSDTAPDYYFGAYITDSRDWDNLLFNAPYYLMVVAAGNDGDTNYNGAPLDGNAAYDKLTGHATSKNNLVVANANDANIDSNGNLISVVINSSSSEGPTDDYRIKPDITGNGTAVYSTYETTNTAYASITGTSMASPNVAGTLLLLQQHYNDLNGNFMRAATLKGLALHTADDAGPNGPDAVYGWGLLNAKKAAETISTKDNGSIIEELTLSQGQSLQITVNSDGINELRASISWTDRPGTATTQTNNTTARLVNDLDLRITQNANTYLPWRLTGVTTNGKGDNIKDPFERVEVPGASGTYTVTITHKGTLTGGSQNYSLIVTGITSTSCGAAVTAVTGGETCGEGTVELSATGNGDTEELRLYTNSLGGTPIDTIIGNSGTFTTPVLTQTTTYYVGAFGGGCESPRVAVTATYLPAPSALVLTRTDNPIGGGDCDFNCTRRESFFIR
ncbi:MAG: S8 family serine peptidase [Weeksellaceae bacterium]